MGHPLKFNPIIKRLFEGACGKGVGALTLCELGGVGARGVTARTQRGLVPGAFVLESMLYLALESMTRVESRSRVS